MAQRTYFAFLFIFGAFSTEMVKADVPAARKSSSIAMSALGQKQTCAPQKAMSALPPKADICSALAHVCYGPIADILRA
jgi:hypothetical protein